MTRKELIEAIARAMAECEPRSLYGDAVAALSAIEAAGVRLVPAKCTDDMAGYAGARAEARGDIRMLPGEYRAAWEAMLAASPYAALKETGQ